MPPCVRPRHARSPVALVALSDRAQARCCKRPSGPALSNGARARCCKRASALGRGMRKSCGVVRIPAGCVDCVGILRFCAAPHEPCGTSQALRGLGLEFYDSLKLCDHHAMFCDRLKICNNCTMNSKTVSCAATTHAVKCATASGSATARTMTFATVSGSLSSHTWNFATVSGSVTVP